MAKTKISEYDATAGNNTDINSINIDEGCSPSGINNAIRALMSHLKAWQGGTSGDTLSIASGGTGQVTASTAINALLPTQTSNSGKYLTTDGSAASWGAVVTFSAGMILMWSGTIATIPSGWYLCNGSNGTPDLRNKFIIGAFSDTSGVAYSTITGSNTQTGGTKDAITVSHTHTATVTDPSHRHTATNYGSAQSGADNGGAPVMYPTGSSTGRDPLPSDYATTGISVTNSTTGSSGTDQNLPPYFALAFIMKA
jgi:hypothetical protein